MIELLKPITWFAPMWAFGCGLVSAGLPLTEKWPVILAGVALAGPLVCGTSQVVNDWYDRHVDAINEPQRPVPSGRVPGRIAFYYALAWSALSLLVASLLGPWIFGAVVFGLVLAWAYSAPPLRLKQDGWWGCAAVGLCYEGLPWFTGAAVMAGALPDWRILLLAGLYSVGAHGIMTLNDFKAVEGDRRLGLRSLPVRYGVTVAARVACVIMAVPQVAVLVLLWLWGRDLHAAVIAALLLAQFVLMARLMQAPRERAPWYNATGTTLYVIGMLIAAFAVAPLVSAS
ncbi:MAG: chlorophyll synthase ChlG [Kiloniellaceae bacterium]